MNRIAKTGIFIAFKKGHKRVVDKELTNNPKSRKMSFAQREKIHKEINNLVELGIISKSKSLKIYPNNIFIISSNHRSTKDRLIFDMAKLNKSINRKKFTMTKISEIIPHLYENNFACSFDIKKAYFHIPINDKYKKYFSFKFNNTKWEFNAMPFGLNTAPYIFTKFISPILEYLRKHYNIIIFSYIDDFLVLGKSQNNLTKDIKTTIDLFEELGFLLNTEKSQLTPTQEISFLGIDFNLEKKTMCNSQRLIDKVRKQATDLYNQQHINRLEIERFIGLGNFMTTYMKNGRHYLHPIIKIANFYLPRTNRKKLLPNRKDLQEELKHWTEENSFHKVPIANILPQISLEVDSSKSQWGATLILENSNLTYQGQWSKAEASHHINQKELLAVLRALEKMPQEIQNIHLQINNDNTTAISTLNKMGSHRSAIRQQITSQILQELTKRNCTYEAHHIPGSKVVLADFLSREEHLLPTEIQISESAFHNLTKNLNIKPQIDIFATRFNTKTTNYHSSIQDGQAEHINTFTSKWSNYKIIYAFPPPNLIHKILYKWKKEKKGIMLLIAPDWPTQAWYSPLQLQTKRKSRIKLGEKDLFLQTRSGPHYFPSTKFHLTAHIL